MIGGGIGAAVAIKLLTRPKTVSWDDAVEAIPHGERSRFTYVDGIRVHFQEFGDRKGIPIVLIHGYTASLFVWRSVAPMLADAGFYVVAVDLVGFGYSDKPKGFDYTIDSQARMISRFMNRLGIGRAVLVGSSYGGAVAMTIALDYPEFVDKVVLIDPVSNNEVKKHPILRLADIPGIGEVVTPFLVDSRTLLRFRMRGTIARSNHHLITEERISGILRPLSGADGHHSVLTTSRHWQADRIEKDAHLIRNPVLIIWGEEDSVIGIHNGYRLYDSILNSRFIILKDCGHVPAEEKSDIVADLITSFCKDKKGKLDTSQGDASIMRQVG